MTGFKNVKAYVKDKGVITADIAVENGVIVGIGEDLGITDVLPFSDGQVVTAGFIDEHIHGAAGFDAMDGEKKALFGIADALVK